MNSQETRYCVFLSEYEGESVVCPDSCPLGLTTKQILGGWVHDETPLPRQIESGLRRCEQEYANRVSECERWGNLAQQLT